MHQPAAICIIVYNYTVVRQLFIYKLHFCCGDISSTAADSAVLYTVSVANLHGVWLAIIVDDKRVYILGFLGSRSSGGR